MKKKNKENLLPINNKGGFIRRIFDFQINSIYRGIKKIFAEMPVEPRDKKQKVLDVGCGNQPYRYTLLKKYQYEGIDWANSEEEFKCHSNEVEYYDGNTFPKLDKTYDLVFHTEVAEHIFDQAHFFNECYRVLKNKGKMIFSIPFSARYHYIPNDYWRLTPASIEMLLKKAGFKEIKIIPRSDDVCVAAYKVLSIGYRWFFSKNVISILFAFIFSPIWVLALIIGQISLCLNLGSKDDCLGYVVLCEKD